MPTDKPSTTFRLSEEARVLLDQLGQWYQISLAAVLEVAIRAMHRLGPLELHEEDVRAAMRAVQPEPLPVVKPGKRPRGRPRKAKGGEASSP